MPNKYIPLLYQAMLSPLGLVLTTNDFPAAIQQLYKARKDCADEDLAVLQFRRSPHNPESEIWLVKGSTPGSAPQAAETVG